MNIVVASTFRDSTGYLDRYLTQTAALRALAESHGDSIRFLWGENDSIDNTSKLLREVDGPITVLDCSTGAPYYQSNETHPDRWANVAAYTNPVLDQITEQDDTLIWVESDLIWNPATLLLLASKAPELGVVAAPVWHQRGFFYDTWTTCLNGVPFRPARGEGIVKVDSCAGCIAVRGDLARVHRFPAEDMCKGWTRNMGGVWLDTDLEVIHP